MPAPSRLRRGAARRTGAAIRTGAVSVLAGATAAVTLLAGPAGAQTPSNDVRAAAPTLRPATCTGPGSSAPARIRIPDVEGVDYSLDGALAAAGARTIAPGQHAVTAVAQTGYRLLGRNAFPVSVPARPACLTRTRPVRPSVTQAACTHGTLTRPSYRVPRVDGVVYAVNGTVRRPGRHQARPHRRLKVTAVPASGYRFAGRPSRTYTLHTQRLPRCGAGAGSAGAGRQ